MIRPFSSAIQPIVRSSPFDGSPPVSNKPKTASKSSTRLSRMFIFSPGRFFMSWRLRCCNADVSPGENENASIIRQRRMPRELRYFVRDLFNDRLREEMIVGLHVRNQSIEPILVSRRIATFSDSI